MGRIKQTRPAVSTAKSISNLLPPYKPGQCGNPNGRPMGSRQKLTEKFISDLADHYEREGAKAIARVLDENPVAYLQIVCRLLPKDISLTVSNDLSSSLPPEQLKRIAEAWMVSQTDDDALEGESVVLSGKETAALPAPAAEPMLAPARVKESVAMKREFGDLDDDGDADPDKPRKRTTRPVVRR
jgi:hypothetical protein